MSITHSEVQQIGQLVRSHHEHVDRLLTEIRRVIVGQENLLKKMLVGLLADGHILLEGVPGLAKTMTAACLARAIRVRFQRIQFTPDLLPGDITGGYYFDRAENRFILRKGPIFANIILADEINRASPRTQSALLEAMQEYQVTLEGETMKLPQPFMVIATQNPIEYEGTYPLPEAQLDRFIMRLSVGYPTAAEEQEVLKRRRDRRQDAIDLEGVTDAAGLLAMRQAVETVHVDTDIERYMVELTRGTRSHRQVSVGASPRGALALLKLSRAWAAMQGREYVIPDDVKLFIKPALSHRLILEPDLWTVPQAAERVLSEVSQIVPVPVIGASKR